MSETTLDVGREPLDIDSLVDVLRAIQDGRRVAFRHGGAIVAVTCSPEEWAKLEAVMAREESREQAERRGQAWEPAEDALLLDDALDAAELAERTGRTRHSVIERRRWLRRIAEGKAA